MDTAHSYSRQALLLRITLFFWLVGKAISWKVWMADRLFPLIPPFDFLSAVPSWAHTSLFCISGAATFFLLLMPGRRSLIWLLLITDICSCALDQNRWQPWEYQYLFTLLIFLINWKRPERILPAMLFMLAAIYFYSGIQKMNSGFVYIVWENLILKTLFGGHDPNKWPLWIFYIGYTIPLIEFLAGFALFGQRYRRWAAIVLIGMHVLNLFLLGPWGLSYNQVIWPWNILMAVSLVILVLYPKTAVLDLDSLQTGWNRIVIVCWLFLPALNFVHCWDDFLSSNLYSGKTPIVTICLLDENAPKELQAYVKKEDLYQICGGRGLINVQLWALDEIGVPPYSEMRVLKKIRNIFVARYPRTDAQMFYNTYPFAKDNWKEMR